MSKNIVMQELTDNGYDALYPKTSADQIEGIDSRIWQVGDVRCTAKTDLDDSWLLCNGTYFFGESYPVLSKLCPQSLEAKTLGVVSEGLSGDTKTFFVNGEWVIFSGDAFYTSITLERPWTKHEIGKTSNNLDFNCDSVFYKDGLWVIVGAEVQSPTRPLYYSFIYTTTNLLGEWTGYRLTSTYDLPINYVTYCGGYWLIVRGGNEGRFNLFWSKDPTNQQSWQLCPVNRYYDIQGQKMIHSIAYYNGLWVAVGKFISNDNTYPLVITSTNPEVEWNGMHGDYAGGFYYSVECYNGMWVMGGQAFAATEHPESNKQYIRFNDIIIYKLICDNGQWALVGRNINTNKPYFELPKDITNPQWSGVSSEIKGEIFDVIPNDRGFVRLGNSRSDTNVLYGGCLWRIKNLLPSITSDLTYNYIKAKP